MIAPDQTTIDWLKDRPFSPKGDQWQAATQYWSTLASDAGAVFDKSVVIDCSKLSPHITWGTSPEQVIAINQTIPLLTEATNSVQRKAWEDALEYMGLQQGASIVGTPIQRVFIGSCTNSRLTDLQLAALDWHVQSEGGISNYEEFQTAAAAVTAEDFPALGTLSDNGIFALRLDGGRYR